MYAINVYIYIYTYAVLITNAIIKPYNAIASEKIIINIKPTYNFSCLPDDRTPISPVMPIAIPLPKPLKPDDKPAAKCLNPSLAVYPSFGVFFN